MSASGARGRAAASVAALAASVAAIVVPLPRAGIWEPRELEVAELARRVGARLLGGSSLAVVGDPDALPSLGDLRSGELPFVAIGASFRLFGLHPWAGRLALAAFAIAGLLATFALLARFAGLRAAGVASIVLASTPLYAVHARTMLGDAAAMGAFAMAFAGLAGVVLEPRLRAVAVWAALASLGLVLGYLARGVLFGVAVPLLGASAGALLVGPALPRASAQRRVLVGACGVALGVACVVTFTREALVHGASGDGVVTRVTGVAFEAPTSGATFETIARRLAHALFPWSVLAPIALGRALARPPRRDGASGERDALHVMVLLGGGVALAASTLVAPIVVDPPFVGVAACAAAIALAFDDLADGAAPSPSVALATLVLTAVLAADLFRDPGRVLAAYGGGGSTFPESLVAAEKGWIGAVAAGVGIAAAAAAAIGPARTRSASWGPRRAVAERLAQAGRLRRSVAAAWNGNLAFLLVVVEAALVGLAAMVLLGRALDWSSIVKLPELYQRVFLHLFWMAPACVIVALAIPTIVADAVRGSARRVGASPPTFVATVAAAAALAFVVGFHPTLAAQISPREALDAFATLHREREPLGLLGMSPRLVAYHGGGDVRGFARVDAAFAWLAGDEAAPQDAAPRRWLVVPRRELAKLNVLHRSRFGRNLAVADASSSQALLAVSDLDGAPQRSPLADVVLDQPPDPARKVPAQLGDELELLGWEVRDASGAVVDSVTTRTHLEARLYLRVLGEVDPSFAPFFHVDRGKLRFNGDQSFVDRGYGPSSWLVGDVIVLRCDVFLEANFPTGDADVYFGFFAGTTRMKVEGGAASLDRVKLGKLRVR